MKTIKTISIAFLVLGMSACSNADTKTGDTMDTTKKVDPAAVEISYTVDPAQSKVQWRGSILSVKSHEGTLAFKRGEFTTKGGQLHAGEFIVDMSSITPTDENYQPEEGHGKPELVGHLSSPDFFDVGTHPTATLTMKDGVATLTVRGQSKEVELKNFVIEDEDGMANATAELIFDRQDFGVAYTGAKDMIISNDVALKVSVVGNKM